MKHKLAKIFMAMGVVLIASALALLLYNSYENKKAYNSSLSLLSTVRTVIDENKINSGDTDPFDEEMLIKEINGYGYIGYLSVPALGLDLPVMSQWDYGRLKISPCRYYGSTKTDNLVIAAHNYKSHFGYLGKLQQGDLITFTDMEGEVSSYRVTVIEILQPTDVDKVKDTGDDLILYTCTYRGQARITVRCSLEGRS